MLYTVKLFDLSPYEVDRLKRALGYYVRHDIKITFLKRVVYVHCDSKHPYQGLFNIIHWYVRSGRLSCNAKTAKWLSGYYPFNWFDYESK